MMGEKQKKKLKERLKKRGLSKRQKRIEKNRSKQRLKQRKRKNKLKKRKSKMLLQRKSKKKKKIGRDKKLSYKERERKRKIRRIRKLIKSRLSNKQKSLRKQNLRETLKKTFRMKNHLRDIPDNNNSKSNLIQMINKEPLFKRLRNLCRKRINSSKDLRKTANKVVLRSKGNWVKKPQQLLKSKLTLKKLKVELQLLKRKDKLVGLVGLASMKMILNL